MQILNINRILKKTCGLHGVGVIKSIVMSSVAVLFLAISVLVFYGGRQWYWDQQVKKMCGIDGGVKIFNIVSISPSEAAYMPKADGVLSVSPKILSNTRSPVSSISNKDVLHSGSLKIVRISNKIIRNSDGKLISSAVIYMRSGGDFPIVSFPSSYYCPTLKSLNTEISKIFKVQESTE